MTKYCRLLRKRVNSLQIQFGRLKSFAIKLANAAELIRNRSIMEIYCSEGSKWFLCILCVWRSVRCDNKKCSRLYGTQVSIEKLCYQLKTVSICLVLPNRAVSDSVCYCCINSKAQLSIVIGAHSNAL